MKNVPVVRGNDASRDWRVILMRLFRVRRIIPTKEKVLERVAELKNEITQARMYNEIGCVHQAYREFDKAAEYFEKGIAQDPNYLENYLDRGFLYCMVVDKENAGKILDQIAALDLTEEQKETMRYDWRAIELYFTAERPMPEDDYE